MNEVLKRLDSRLIPASEPGVRAFLCVRNEQPRLPYMLDYHRRLGVRRFFIVDNDSLDGTAECLLNEPDVHLWQTASSYRDSHFGVKWAVPLMNQYADDRWALFLDADEYLAYPECETVDLDTVCTFLDRQNFRVLPTMLLDMYSAHSVIETTFEVGQDMRSVCPYFDGEDYFLNPATGDIAGGVRHRIFKSADVSAGPPIVLSKFALRRWIPGPDLDRGVHRTSLPGARSTLLTGALLHFKFIASFVQRAQEESVRKEHWNGASEYAAYVRKFAESPDLCLMGPPSVRYENSEQLVQLGFMMASSSYRDFVQNPNGAPTPRVMRYSAGGIDE